MKQQVIVTHRVHGFHFFPNAPDEVSYLQNRHRHLFFMTVAWNVTNANREVEFHIAQSWLKKEFTDPQDFGARSCEMIAKLLYDKLTEAGHPVPAWIEVWEDEENGSRIEFDSKD